MALLQTIILEGWRLSFPHRDTHIWAWAWTSGVEFKATINPFMVGNFQFSPARNQSRTLSRSMLTLGNTVFIKCNCLEGSNKGKTEQLWLSGLRSSWKCWCVLWVYLTNRCCLKVSRGSLPRTEIVILEVLGFLSLPLQSLADWTRGELS